ncbi:MAG: efflux RND transporter periplasmic adaptor subunit [Bacteroidales bacterium]|jgi:RND family efflux transporter MFP subunit|nr:efflux RND transporter periplasmic adaptor subunit [Bacteroidales bacterium]MBQ1656337.1 efflux RND transporter periplasmic adaptor subunit [Bacteroidales bacterium]MBQ4026609.1 efflux RND transporter periplasmic adaptor subunit [Bacteroidales bacterium]MBQ5363720.1 efflux RND transporter periplasmic adaptor subunit [Bacteroidales bacterium]
MNKSFLLVATVLMAAGCGSQNNQAPATQQAPQEPQVALVSVVAAARENVPQTSLYSSTVQAKVVNNIAPQGAGRIQKLNVEVGDFVAKGQVLAEMDKVQLEQAQLKLRNDETELERVRTLLSQGGISQADFDQLELAFNVSKSSCRNIEENTILRSPVSGVITARNYDRGDMFTMGQPIYTVQQITPVKILVGISETDYTRVKKGDTVSITADALPGKEFSGTVNRLYPTMDPATHTFNVEVTVPNTRRELRPGMYARVTVNFGSTFNIVLPDTAVLKMQGAGTRSVFVVDPEGKAEMRVVTLGRHFDGKYEILSGLEEGEQVVVKGNSALKAGQAVQIG